MAFMRRKVKMR